MIAIVILETGSFPLFPKGLFHENSLRILWENRKPLFLAKWRTILFVILKKDKNLPFRLTRWQVTCNQYQTIVFETITSFVLVRVTRIAWFYYYSCYLLYLCPSSAIVFCIFIIHDDIIIDFTLIFPMDECLGRWIMWRERRASSLPFHYYCHG